MAIYELRCARGHQFEVIQSFAAELPDCPTCGSATGKVPSRFAVGGRAAVPPRHDQLPQTWRGTYHGNRDYLARLRATAEARTRLEDKHPELAGDQRPVLAHEGRYETTPLRLGDTPQPSSDHQHDHTHGHTHGHGHRTDPPPFPKDGRT